ncbi:MAG: phage minor head protein [Capnocytophaga sp.]|nr:phage minor head protein [Capnocytophaga sp.]
MSRFIQKYIREIFENRSLSDGFSEKLWRLYYRRLSEGITEGIRQENPDLTRSLKRNIAQFSAFKETSFRSQLEAALTQGKRVLPWHEFKAEADRLDADYNRRWLQAEYHQTVANAQAADKYQEHLKNKHLYPNLRYKTINDQRVREKHKAWDGIVLPVEHPFWKTHLPPNDWGCRCYTEPTADPVSQGIRTDEQLKEEFANNPALTGVVFGKIPYEKGMTEAEKKEVRKKSEKWLGKENAKQKTETWETVKTNNGSVKVSSFHGKNEKTENIEIASYFANKYNHEIELLRKLEVEKSADVFNKTLGIEQEYKRVSKPTKSAVDNALRSAYKQAENVVLDIKSNISDGDLRDAILNRIRRVEEIKTLVIINNGYDATYTKEDILREGWSIK